MKCEISHGQQSYVNVMNDSQRLPTRLYLVGRRKVCAQQQQAQQHQQAQQQQQQQQQQQE
jgi:hypothetical protein